MKNTVIPIAGVVSLWAALFATPVTAVELTIACGAVGLERQVCIDGANRWAQQTGHSVDVIATPQSSTERLAMYQLLLRERHNTVDVFQIDVIWPGLLGEYLLDLSPYVPDSSAFFPNLMANNTVDDRLIAMPWYVDTGLLYYREDLLEQYGHPVPQTWNELEAIATDVQRGERSQNGNFWGYVWQGNDYEGLTCNVMEWLVSNNGGTVVDASGVVTLDNDRASDIIGQAASWIDTISPPAVLDYQEEDARAHFEAGNALFMRNWPYAWRLANEPESKVAGKVGVTVLPRGETGAPSGALGGWQLAVTQATRYPNLSVDLVRFLTSEGEQRRRAEFGYLPTRTALYQEAELTRDNAVFAPVGQALENVAVRPSSATGRTYKYVSRYLSGEVHEVLRGNKAAPEALASITDRIVERGLGELQRP
ncbi:ABC transporter substrate-binding protein [Saccharospirillum impatiens]|uniref:ABC transporter substrate-binding protein n=1 Tax=Saccharospirillum impatiens TaxID=169438 RepID=UPI0003F8CC5F|nr:ABC transporter substrate-binding protein [Saccharospirillum impatiens]